MRVPEDSTSGGCKFRIETFIVKINAKRYLRDVSLFQNINFIFYKILIFLFLFVSLNYFFFSNPLFNPLILIFLVKQD